MHKARIIQHPGAMANTSTQLAIDRTRLAHDRTMLSWVRTATSLITFGFSVYKFFSLEIKEPPEGVLLGSRGFGILMIVTGLTSLLLATIQHRRDRNLLKELDPDTPRSEAAALAAFIAILGIVALAAAIWKL
jgi:putative membrane protein